MHRTFALVYYKICATSSMNTPWQAASVNVMTLKSGFTSAIFFNHSKHAPHGFKGLRHFKSAGTRATTPPAAAPMPPPPLMFWLGQPGVLVAAAASMSVAEVKQSRRLGKILRTHFVPRCSWESSRHIRR